MSTISLVQFDHEQLMSEIVSTIKNLHNEFLERCITPTAEDKRFSPAEAALELKVNLSTISNWRKSGQLRSWRAGGRVYIKQSDIDDCLKLMKPGRQL